MTRIYMYVYVCVCVCVCMCFSILDHRWLIGRWEQASLKFESNCEKLCRLKNVAILFKPPCSKLIIPCFQNLSLYKSWSLCQCVSCNKYHRRVDDNTKQVITHIISPINLLLGPLVVQVLSTRRMLHHSSALLSLYSAAPYDWRFLDSEYEYCRNRTNRYSWLWWFIRFPKSYGISNPLTMPASIQLDGLKHWGRMTHTLNDAYMRPWSESLMLQLIVFFPIDTNPSSNTDLLLIGFSGIKFSEI